MEKMEIRKRRNMENVEIRRKRQRTPVPTGMPWLVFPCGKDREHQTFCTILSSSSSSNTISTVVEQKNIPELHKAEFRACHHGWILLTTEDDDHSWRLWNPTTYESVKLPPIDKKMVKSSIFTAPPKNPGCKVLLFYQKSPTISYCQPGDQEWVTHNYRREISEIDTDKENSLLQNLACLDGVIYALTCRARLVSIKFDNQTGLKLIAMGLDQLPVVIFRTNIEIFLFESFGQLFTVYISSRRTNTTIGIQFFRWDFSQKVWLNVENLDDRLILLGNIWNSMSCLATDMGFKGNKILFMRPQDKLLYVYDLEEQTVLASLPWPRLKSPWYQPSWVMPCYPHVKSPQDKISKAMGEYKELVVESPKDADASEDQYPGSLNLDTWTVIAKHLEPLDYLEFRASCKLFCSAAPLTKCSIRSIAGALKSPWLVTFGYNKNVFSLTDPMHNNIYHVKVPESLRGTIINGYKDGYLLMADEKNMFYFNPFTGKQEKIPTGDIFYNRLSFTSSPSSSDCVAVNLYGDDALYVEYLLPWLNFWVHQPLVGDYRGFHFHLNGPGVLHRKMLYYLSQEGKLGVMKLEFNLNAIFNFKVLEKPKVPIKGFYHNYLTECNEELVAVFVGQNGNWVKVFRLDHSKMRWVRVRNLGNYSVFLSNRSSIAAVARSRGMENKVYFPRFYNKSIVYYSLETEKFHTHGNNAVLKSFVDTKEQLYCTWIEPNCFDPNEQIRPNWQAELEVGNY